MYDIQLIESRFTANCDLYAKRIAAVACSAAERPGVTGGKCAASGGIERVVRGQVQGVGLEEEAAKMPNRKRVAIFHTSIMRPLRTPALSA
jgi:hypothetical protein